MKKILIFTFITTLSILNANSNDLKPQCARPLKPVEFTSNSEIDQYNNSVQAYQDCLFAFVDKHKEKMNQHSDAVNLAIEEWNGFVNGDKPKAKEGNGIYGQTGPSENGSHTVGESDPTKFYKDFKF